MSIRILTCTAIAAAIACASASAASADVFLKVDGAPGDAVQRGFEGQIVLTGASLNISGFTMPDPEGFADGVRSTSVGPLFLNKSPDRSSPRLMQAAVEGAPLGTIEISFTSAPRLGQPESLEARWIIDGAEVRSFNTYPDLAAGGQAIETVEISFLSMRYQYFTKDSKGVRSGSMEEVKWSVPDEQLFPFDQCCR